MSEPIAGRTLFSADVIVPKAEPASPLDSLQRAGYVLLNGEERRNCSTDQVDAMRHALHEATAGGDDQAPELLRALAEQGWTLVKTAPASTPHPDTGHLPMDDRS